MARAIWNNKIIAESDHVEKVEGNLYFPPDSIRKEYYITSSLHTSCPWKGEASYYDLEVDGQINKDAAWYYPQPYDAAAHIRNHIAFWKGVTIEE